MGRVILVTGPARSGKSEWAETLAMQSGKSVIYVATAQVDPADSEWLFRIEQHRCRRPRDWVTLEVPYQLVATIETATLSSCLLVDSLGTWVANLLEEDDTSWEGTGQNLLLSLQQVAGDVILVAEETGWGVVPAYPIGRRFRDRLGSWFGLGRISVPINRGQDDAAGKLPIPGTNETSLSERLASSVIASFIPFCLSL